MAAANAASGVSTSPSLRRQVPARPPANARRMHTKDTASAHSSVSCGRSRRSQPCPTQADPAEPDIERGQAPDDHRRQSSGRLPNPARRTANITSSANASTPAANAAYGKYRSAAGGSNAPTGSS
jgi:hypothetical protein